MNVPKNAPKEQIELIIACNVAFKKLNIAVGDTFQNKATKELFSVDELVIRKQKTKRYSINIYLRPLTIPYGAEVLVKPTILNKYFTKVTE